MNYMYGREIARAIALAQWEAKVGAVEEGKPVGGCTNADLIKLRELLATPYQPPSTCYGLASADQIAADRKRRILNNQTVY